MHYLNGDGDCMATLDENHDEMQDGDDQAAVPILNDLNAKIVQLERKIFEQNDELVCLKATLAETIRRLTVLEQLVPSVHNRAPPTPIVNKLLKSTPPRPHSTGIPPPSGGAQRRAVHYQSSSSLHSDSHSSSSVSPAPSPQPRNKPPPTPQPTAPNNLHKRWSSTGDFNQNTHITAYNNIQSKFSTKSFLNLYTKSNTSTSSSLSTVKHGTKDAIFNEDEKTIRFFLHGHPIVLCAPSEYGFEYDLNKVTIAPVQKLKLDWVYGYRGRDCRWNLHFLPTGELVYFVAAVIILYNVEEQSQRHYLGHTDEIKCIAIHPNKMMIATGQGGVPNIRIWNSVSLQTQIILNDFQTSICCLSFSKTDGGVYLAVIEEGTDHLISLWDWQKNNRITETKSSPDTIVAVEYHPLIANYLITIGKDHCCFWSVYINDTIHKRIGLFETRDKPKYVTSIGFLQTGETITGDSNGNLAIWYRGGACNTTLKLYRGVHEGAIFTICVLKHGYVVTGGGKDGRLIQLTPNLQNQIHSVQIEQHFGGVRVVSENWAGQLVVGTTKNCILIGTLEMGFQPIMLGHSDEITGLALHPKIEQFVTAGCDKVLQLWDSMSHNILWSKDIGAVVQSLSFSQDGTYILLTTDSTNNKVQLFDIQTRSILGQFSIDNNNEIGIIQCIDCAPDGQILALGTQDGSIYLYEIPNGTRKFNKIGKCTGHSAAITHLDWTLDNQVLRSNSADYELLHWNTNTCRQIIQTSLIRDCKWATNKCPITFTTIGLWSENDNMEQCDCSHNKKLLAAGDQFGKIKLFNYPAIQTKALCHTYGGHSGPIRGIQFLHEDTRLITIGGKDQAIFQWIVS